MHINKRNKWYYYNKVLIKKTQSILILISVALALFFLIKYHLRVLTIPTLQALGLAVTGFIALSYYGVTIGSVKINARNTGWLKPFVIGFVWATAVTYIPILWYEVEKNVYYNFTSLNLWFFLK